MDRARSTALEMLFFELKLFPDTPCVTESVTFSFELYSVYSDLVITINTMARFILETDHPWKRIIRLVKTREGL